jgi:transposase
MHFYASSAFRRNAADDGQQPRMEPMFYYFRLEDQIPEHHLLRQIDRYVDFRFVRERLRDAYSSMGRPSIDPEILLRILLVGYLYGITSERRLMEELRMHLAYRWFTRLGFQQEIPNHSTFSKNRHFRFRESGIFLGIFEQIVRCCLNAGLVEGKRLTVDGMVVTANASPQRGTKPEQLPEVAKVSRTVREYLAEVAQENPLSGHEEDPPAHNSVAARYISTTDPDACWAAKYGRAVPSYFDHYLIDNAHCIILGVEATRARFRQETLAARRMLVKVKERFGVCPESVGGDKAYGSGEFLAWLLERNIQPHIPVIDRRHQTHRRFTREQFQYDPVANVFDCPQGQALRFQRVTREQQGYIYRTTESQCRGCPVKKRCTPAPFRKIFVHWHEPARQVARELAHTPAYACSKRERSKIEALFSELKLRVGLRRVRLRRLWNVAEQFYLAATAQNLKRMVKFLVRRELMPVSCTT